jgi:hypothetical protein
MGQPAANETRKGKRSEWLIRPSISAPSPAQTESGGADDPWQKLQSKRLIDLEFSKKPHR